MKLIILNGSEGSKKLNTQWEGWCSIIPYELPECPEKISKLIDAISIMRINENYWLDPGAGFAEPNLVKDIQNCLDNKNAKLKEYLKKCSTCWLLIVASAKPSSFINPNGESLNYVYTSDFERVYLLDYPRQPYLLKLGKM